MKLLDITATADTIKIDIGISEEKRGIFQTQTNFFIILKKGQSFIGLVSDEEEEEEKK